MTGHLVLGDALSLVFNLHRGQGQNRRFPAQPSEDCQHQLGWRFFALSNVLSHCHQPLQALPAATR